MSFGKDHFCLSVSVIEYLLKREADLAIFLGVLSRGSTQFPDGDGARSKLCSNRSNLGLNRISNDLSDSSPLQSIFRASIYE